MSSAHQGRRQRLRESILAGQLEDLGEIDFLEMLLTYAIPRKDVRPIAEQLMQRFLNLPGVLSATPRSLRRVNGVGEVTVAFLKLVDRIRSLPRNGQPFPPLVIETGSSPTRPLALSSEEPESAVNSNETDPQVRSRSGRSVTREAKLLITNSSVQPPETDTKAILEQQPAQPPRTSQTQKRRPKRRGHEEVAPSQKINRQEILAGFSIPDGSSQTRDSPTEVVPKPSKRREDIRAIQDLIWKEALLTLPWSEEFEDVGEFQHYIREHLPQNSLSTRDRYAQTVVRWFYPDGLKGLTAEVWRHYRDPGLAEEILRYRYLCAETMAGALVADALFPIGENAAIPDSYIVQFIRERFGSAVPDKTTERLKANLRKLGFLSSGKERRDLLRPIAPSATAFLILLHFLFSQGQPGGVEFRVIASEPFWKYLGYKSEDRLRAILREALDRGMIAKYVVADRIESISLRYSFSEFVEGRMRL